MKYAYYESKWKRNDLDGKTLQFSLCGYSGRIQGTGVMMIHVYGDLISVCIHGNRDQTGEDVLNLWNPELADKIEVHADKSLADFRLVE